MTPGLTRAVVHLAGEVRSFDRTATATERVLGQKVPQSTVRRLANQVGQELSEQARGKQRRDGKQAVAPQAAVVSCDGGRIRAREPGCGRGVRLSGETGWRETKNASFERIRFNRDHGAGEDPCPELPTAFCTAKRVAKIAEKPVPSEAGASAEQASPSADPPPDRVKYEGPQRVLRTALSSMACSNEFGPMMQREARRRGFYKSDVQAFVGDGLPWNWSIQKAYFPTFVPILDFIHAIQYVYSAAVEMTTNAAEAWAAYVRLVTCCWQGRVDAVIEELREVCRDRGIPLDEKLDEKDPRRALADAVRYLTNNRTRMDYPRYRQMGLPVTSAPMESLIKQINLRVKGTEMFWDDPDGAEAILHLRAAVLCDDNRLDDYLAHRPGCPFHRRTSAPTNSA